MRCSRGIRCVEWLKTKINAGKFNFTLMKRYGTSRLVAVARVFCNHYNGERIMKTEIELGASSFRLPGILRRYKKLSYINEILVNAALH